MIAAIATKAHPNATILNAHRQRRCGRFGFVLTRGFSAGGSGIGAVENNRFAEADPTEIRGANRIGFVLNDWLFDAHLIWDQPVPLRQVRKNTLYMDGGVARMMHQTRSARTKPFKFSLKLKVGDTISQRRRAAHFGSLSRAEVITV